MNILFVLSSFAHRAGVERVISDKMNYLAEQGHHVVFVTYEQGQHPLILPLHNSIMHVDIECPYFTLYRYPLYLRLIKAHYMSQTFLKRLQSLVDEQCIDVLVTPTNASMFMGEMMKLKRVRKIVESHGAFVKTMISDHFIANVSKKMQLRAIKKCDLLISLTDGDANCWKKYVKNIEVLPNPVPFYYENVNGLEKQSGRIIAVGGLNKSKRFDRLIDAFALISRKFPKWHIDIYGDGNDKYSLEQLIQSLGLVHCIQIHPSTDQIVKEYLRSELFVLCSDTEGFSLVLIEAMASGLPCVATRCPFGPSEIIDDGITGLLCQLTAQDLAAKMEWLMNHEKERIEMGVKAHQAAARYKKEHIMREWERAYCSVIDK